MEETERLRKRARQISSLRLDGRKGKERRKIERRSPSLCRTLRGSALQPVSSGLHLRRLLPLDVVLDRDALEEWQNGWAMVDRGRR